MRKPPNIVNGNDDEMMEKSECGKLWTNILCRLTRSKAFKRKLKGQNARKYHCLPNETPTASYAERTPHTLARPSPNDSQVDPVVAGEVFLVSSPRSLKDFSFIEQCRRGRRFHPRSCRFLPRNSMVKTRTILLPLSACLALISLGCFGGATTSGATAGPLMAVAAT